MILAEQIYMLIRNELETAGIRAYSDRIPTEIIYPFCMYEIPDTVSKPEWAFEKDYETLTVRFNIYGEKDNPNDVIAIAEQIEEIFNRTKLIFVESEGGIHLVCNYKVDDSIGILKDPARWLAISDYEFIAQRNVGEDADSSSSE